MNLTALSRLDECPRSAATLPLGISFFTFQQIVFLVDAYRHRRRRTGALRYATGVAFFPHLLAGPIVRYSQLMPQFARRHILRPQPQLIAQGVTVFSIGLVKKAILADSFAQFVPIPFGAVAAGHHLTLVEAWAAALSYAFQIYFDFSGYSDMAHRSRAAVRHRRCPSTSTLPTRRTASSNSGGAGTSRCPRSCVTTSIFRSAAAGPARRAAMPTC